LFRFVRGVGGLLHAAAGLGKQKYHLYRPPTD
jgi:hypothetical protein